MKKCWLILSLAIGLPLYAQTNLPASETNAEAPTAIQAAAETNAPATTNAVLERQQTEISSASANFDYVNGVAVYIGNVRIVDPQMKMTCGIMTAHVKGSDKIDSIVAQENVVIDAVDNEGKAIHATADKAVYTYRVLNSVTNETIELTGNPRVEREGGWQTAKSFTWDRVNNTLSAIDQHTVIRQQTIESNSPLLQSTKKK